jgi:NAD(P)-dependent dehydrogenase (short-subunit alcohol dehydrogenase family)
VYNLSERRALVTGASRGLGVAIARALARAGAHVVLNARNEQSLEQLRREIEREGGRAEVRCADLGARESCRELARNCGEIDILVNNAGATAVNRDKPVIEVDDALWDESLQLNLLAPLALMQELGRGMARRGRGVIINITSIAAHQGRPLRAAYTASKAALEAMTRVAAMELAPQGVRVLAIAPGMTQTPALAAALPPGITSDSLARRYIPIGRMVDPEEIGRLCCYLASDEVPALTGTVITLDGGMTAGRYSFTFEPNPQGHGGV